MNITINAIESFMDISGSMTAEEIRSVTTDDEHICRLSEYVLHSWLSITAEVQKDLQPYWSFRDEIAIIDRSQGKANE